MKLHRWELTSGRKCHVCTECGAIGFGVTPSGRADRVTMPWGVVADDWDCTDVVNFGEVVSVMES